MDSHISCLRCAKRIPLKAEMIGQTILCPNCLERVYVSQSSPQEKPLPATSNSGDFSAPSRGVDAAAILKRNQAAPAEHSNVLLLGAVAAVALVAIVGFIVWSLRPPKSPLAIATRSANMPAAPEMDDEPDREEPDGDDGGDDDDPPRRIKGAKGAPLSPTAAAGNPLSGAANTAAPGAAATKASEGEASNQTVPLPQPILPGSAEHWRLPSASASGIAEVLTPLADAGQVLRVGLRSADGDFRFSPIVVEPEGKPSDGTWIIKRRGSPLSNEGQVSLATLRRDGVKLLFAWAAPEHELPEEPSLANCLIELNDGKKRRVGQLREPVRGAPLTLDLDNESQVIEAKLDDLPRLDTVRLEIVELTGLSGDAKVRGGPKAFTTCALSTLAVPKPPTPQPGAPGSMLALGPQPLVIEFTEIPGLEIRLRCTSDPSGKLAISVDPIFRDTQDHDLRVPRLLDRLEAEARKPLPNAERELAPEESKLKTWQAKAKDQKGKEPPQNDFKRHGAWQNEHRKTLAKVSEFESNVSRYKAIVEKCQARLDAVAKLREFMKQVGENQATIQYVVYSECGDPDIVLLDGRGK